MSAHDFVFDFQFVYINTGKQFADNIIYASRTSSVDTFPSVKRERTKTESLYKSLASGTDSSLVYFRNFKIGENFSVLRKLDFKVHRNIFFILKQL